MIGVMLKKATPVGLRARHPHWNYPPALQALRAHERRLLCLVLRPRLRWYICLIAKWAVMLRCGNPGSITKEIQDVPTIVAAAHAKGLALTWDNTYSDGVLFDAFAHGVDDSMQAPAKYVGGHGDLLLG